MEEVQAPQPEVEFTKEQKVAHVKINLLGTLAQFHNSLYNFVYTLPINEDQKKFALANLIQGLHWVEDGIEALEFEVENLNAVEKGKQQESNQPEHTDGSESGASSEASGSDCDAKSGQSETEGKKEVVN